MNNTEDQDAIFSRVWKAFRKAVRSDSAAADMIYRSLRADGRIKCSCSKPKIKRKRGTRFYVCLGCKSKYWFTSGTLFEGAHRLRAWLAAVVRSAAASLARSSSRRERRERTSASGASDVGPSAAELAERMETGRRVAHGRTLPEGDERSP